MRALRRLFFYLFLAVYLAVTPLVLLHALGYRWQPGRDEPWVRTGVVALETVPDNARIYVGESRYTERTPSALRGLRPGAYPIRVTLRGHQSWTAMVPVYSNQATVLDRLLLLPHNLAPVPLGGPQFEELFPQPGGDWFLLSAGPRADQQWVCSTRHDILRPVLPTNHPLAAAAVRARHTVPGSPCLLLEADHEDRAHYLWIRLDDEDREPLDVTSLFPEPPEIIAWPEDARRELYAQSGDRLHRLDLDDRAIYPQIGPHIRTFGFFEDDLYVIDASNMLLRLSRDGDVRESLGPGPPPRALWKSARDIGLHLQDEDVALYALADGSLFANQPPFTLLLRDLHGVARSPDAEVAYVFDGSRAGVVHEDKATAGKRHLSIRWIHQGNAPIDQLFPVLEESHLLIRSGSRLLLAALPRAGGLLPRELPRCAEGTQVLYAERAGSVFLLDPATHGLQELRLLPRRELLSRRRPHAEAAP